MAFPHAAAPMPYRGRFAPSPTGALHLGSLSAAMGSWLLARRQAGEWLVRIEDLDPPREIPGMGDRHVADLARFGMESDRPVVRQSERGDLYAHALRRLRDQGDVFACFCSRSDLAVDGGVHLSCVQNPSGQHAAWRLRVPDIAIAFDDLVRGTQRQSLREVGGDFVLKRADGYWAYQLAVVVDDGEQGITDVVRGADLIDSTARQIQLQRSLGLATPRYAHLPTILGADGAKLSKSLASTPVDPADPLPAMRAVWRLLGQDARALASAGNASRALDCALDAFEPERLPDTDVTAAV